MDGVRLENFIIGIIVIMFSISLHEFGHAIAADKLGDPGPRRMGRITLWPGAHFDPLGFIMICLTMWIGLGIGWGKPVLVEPRMFRNPRRDMILVAIAGPIMNLLLAIVFGIVVRIMLQTGTLPPNATGQLLYGFVLINLSLLFFNLIPIHPLDGGKILSGLLPRDLSDKFDTFMWQWGALILLFSCFSGNGIFRTVISPAVESTARIILGL